MLRISKGRGKGHHQWRVSLDDHEIKGGLTKWEAAELQRTLVKLPAIVKQMVAQALGQVIDSVKGQRDRLQ